MVQSEDQMQILYYESILKTKNNIGKFRLFTKRLYFNCTFWSYFCLLLFTYRCSYTDVKYGSEFCQLSHPVSPNADKFSKPKSNCLALKDTNYSLLYTEQMYIHFLTPSVDLYTVRGIGCILCGVWLVSLMKRKGGEEGVEGWGEGKCCITRAWAAIPSPVYSTQYPGMHHRPLEA